MRYKGKVTAISHHGRAGYIGRHTVTRANGDPVMLDTKTDIFVHTNDFRDGNNDFILEVGQELVFRTKKDDRREKSLRAAWLYTTDDHPIEGSVMLSFPEQTIGHPMVPVTWCLSPAAFARMKAEPGKSWVIMFRARESAAAERDWMNPARSFHRSIIGLEHIAASRTYLNFPASGEWEVVAYLISMTSGPGVRLMLDKFRSDFESIWDEFSLEVIIPETSRDLTINATGHTQVSVPAEVFAPPLPKWVKTWLSYFSARPVDQCVARRGITLAFTLGVIWYLLWEFGKRAYTFLLGLGHLIFGGNPLRIWKLTCAKSLSAPTPYDFWGKNEYRLLGWLRGWFYILHPSLVLAYGSAGALYWQFPDQMKSLLLRLWPYTAGVAIAAGGIVALVHIFNKIFEKAKIRQEELERAGLPVLQSEATSRQLELVGTYALCGALPPAAPLPTSIQLRWDHIKRKVCRNYASG